MRTSLLFLLIFASSLLSGCSSRSEQLIDEGEALIIRIDSFQKRNNQVPENLEELGIKEKMEGPLYYQKLSEQEFMLHFGTRLGESMIYRSTTHNWTEN